MAGADYQHCEECCSRLFFNPYLDEEMQVYIYTEGGLYCATCYNKLLKKINKLQKSLKRGR